MASVSLTINTEAYSRLKKLKGPWDSFSDVILREMPEPWETAGDVLDGLEKMRILSAARAGDGRLVVVGYGVLVSDAQALGPAKLLD